MVTPEPTAVTVGLSHPDAEQTFVSHMRHLALFDAKTIMKQLDELVSGDMLVVCSYFSLSALRRQGKALCESACERGVTVLLDTG